MALVVAAVIVLVVGGGVALWFSRRTDHTTTAVDLGDVVREYRAETSAPPTAAPTTVAPTTAPAVTARPVATASAPSTTLPAARLADPGVYTYTTTGGDGVDALGGASHTYPATTAIVVTPSGCGTTQRWTAAEERWDEATTCAVAGGIALQDFTSFHRFFGSDDRRAGTCTGDPRPVGAPAEATWTTRCDRDGAPETRTGTVVGRQAMAIGGAAVDVEHVVVVIDNGDPADSQRTETWYVAGTDLIARQVAAIATVEGSPVGTVHYTEQYDIVLDSLAPTQ